MILIASNDGRRILCRVGVGEVFFYPREQSACMNHRYAVKPPTRQVGDKMARLYGGHVVLQ